MLEDNQKSNKSNDWKEREIGAFWTRDSAKGKYLSGSIEVDELGLKKKIKVVMFPNRYKDNDKKPDYVLYVSKDAEAPLTEDSSNNQVESTKKEEIPDSLV
jgi:uncharacterized protein (DUF736 family)